MIRSLMIGALTGARSMVPLALVSRAAGRGGLGPQTAVRGLLGARLVRAGSAALALGEIAGDKWGRAPDRIVTAGMAARLLSAGLTGAALAPRGRAPLGAIVAASAAALAAHASFRVRMRAMRHAGQTPTGILEDALTIGAVALLLTRGRR